MKLTMGVHLAEAWQYLRWRSPQIPELFDVLGDDLNRRLRPHETEQALYQNDADEMSIARQWCRELASVVNKWCSLLEVDASSIPEYQKATRALEKFGLVDPKPVVSSLLTICLNDSRLSDKGFHPKCLDRANNELLNWLSTHPSDVDRVHHRTFEAIIKEVISSAGWHVELTKRTRDGGYDLLCLSNGSVGVPVKMIVEGKLYNPARRVGLSTVDRIVGVASREAADRSLVVTNSHYSSDVWRRWETRVGRDLTLVARSELLSWLSEGSALTLAPTQRGALGNSLASASLPNPHSCGSIPEARTDLSGN